MTEDCVLGSHNPASLAIVTAVPLLGYQGDAVHLAYFGSGSKIIESSLRLVMQNV